MSYYAFHIRIIKLSHYNIIFIIFIIYFFYSETFIIHTITTKNESYFILKVRELLFICNLILIYEYIELRILYYIIHLCEKIDRSKI